MTGQILLVEDDDAVRASLTQTIELAGMVPLPMSSYVQAKRSIRANFPGVILTDIRMPQQDGFDVLRAAQTADPDLPVIMLTAHGGVPSALKAMKEGAWDYLEKPCSTDRLVEVLTRALAHRAVVLKSRRIERALLRNDPAAVNFPGSGKVSDGLRTALRAAAEDRGNVYLWGDAGTGRRQAAFVVNQLAAEPCPIVRIDLGRPFDNADLELPEGPVDIICRNAGPDARAAVDALLARASRHEDLRLIVLGDAGIETLGWRGATAAGFTEIRLPTVHERGEDLLEIFEVLLRQTVRTLNIDLPTVPEAVAARLTTSDWSGNLPELRNFAMSFALGAQTQYEALPNQTLADQVEAFEKLVISETLRRTGGNAVETAKSLGLPRNTLYDRLSRYALSPKDFRSKSIG
ncbi:MAG: response regulator [Pseudomonadota bacterium]